MNTYDVFVSYSRKDADVVRLIEKELSSYGITYFIDRSDINLGEDFAEKIARCIYNSEILLFVWSENSNQSENTANEIALAIDFQKTIVPFKIGRFKPDFKLAYRLVRFNRIEAADFNARQIHEMAAHLAGQLGKKQIAEQPQQTSAAPLPQEARDNGESKNKEGEEYIKVFNYVSAFRCFLQAAEEGSLDAMYNLGRCYQNGWSTDVNYEKALKWYRKAADRDHALAIYSIGKMYQAGMGVTSDAEMAIELYKKAARQGYPRGYYDIARCYAEGYGVPADEDKAFEWYMKGAESGDDYCMLYTGIYYEDGTATDIDNEKAAGWYRKAAELGNGEAMKSLSYCYRFGRGVETDNYAADMLYKAFKATVVRNNELAMQLLHEALA